jgi:hypothetical protein
MTDPPYALWSIWKQLSVLQHAFVVVLGGVTIYSLFFAARITLRVRSIRSAPGNEVDAAERSLTALGNSWTNVRQLIDTTSCLFGLVLFIGLQSIGKTVDRGEEILGIEILGNFLLHCAFAANVFFILLVLRLVHWTVGALFNSTAKRLTSAI